MWRRYSKAREAFNRRRGAHFAELDRERATAKSRKEELVARAEALRDSTDWGATAATFRDLLAEWKAAGRAPREADDQLWKRFKGAQDVFFAARNSANAEREAEFEENARGEGSLAREGRDDRPVHGRRGRAGATAGTAGQVGGDRQGAARAHPRPRRPAARRSRSASATPPESEWRRTDPEALARAAQFRERVRQFEEQAAKATANGREKEAEQALAQASQWREWAEAAEGAVGEL